MSPAEARFRLVHGGSEAADRSEVLVRIRARWGGVAAEEVRSRVEAGTTEEAGAWLRRSAYFLDLPSLLDLERTLPVCALRVHDLLGHLTAAGRPALTLILLRFARLAPRDRRCAEQAAPWLEDIPRATHALDHLCSQGWLLVGCGDREQGLALWRCVRPRRGILASRYDLGQLRQPEEGEMPPS